MVVDDDKAFLAVFGETLESLRQVVIECTSGEEALNLLATDPVDLIFLDLRLPGMSGLDVLRSIRADDRLRHVPVVILTAYADSENTIEAMKLGAFDHLTKPIGRNDVEAVVKRALAGLQLSAESSKALQQEDALIGASPSMRRVEKLVGVAASTSAPVCLLGETGTGKKRIARAIHEHSDRQRHAFQIIPCATMKNESLEQILTGAGTVYLDEIADLTPEMQAELLNRAFHPAQDAKGGSRLVAGTSHDLVGDVRDGRFREDLYYRIHVLPIRVPPLRDRGSDILLLAETFLHRLSPANPKLLSADAAKALLGYSWPGNVRELENMMLQLNLTVRGPLIEVADLEIAQAGPPMMLISELARLDYYSAIAHVERLLLETVLKEVDGNRSEAARRLKINRQLLYSKLKEHRLEA